MGVGGDERDVERVCQAKRKIICAITPKAINSGWSRRVRQKLVPGWPCSTVYRFSILL